MTNWLSRWRKGDPYESVLWFESKAFPRVRFGVRRVSLAQRIDLSGRIRELTLRNEFLRAGELTDQLEADLADLMVQKLYLEWAVAHIEGLKIDGKPISVPALIEQGPEKLAMEISSVVRSTLELSDDERKNY